MRIFIVALVGLLSTVVHADDSWQAGIGKIVITPPEPMCMSGYAGRDKPAEGKLHDLWAKAIVLQDPAGHKVLLVSLDLIGIDRATAQGICTRLQRVHGLERAQIAIATSHTHTGPIVGTNLMSMYALAEQQKQLVDRYAVFLSDAVIKAVADAFSSLAPAVIQAGEGHATFAVNRRNNREADVPMLREAGQLVGPVDHLLPVLSIRSPDRKLRGVVFGYACHSTVLSFLQWSGDWPGFAQLEIEKNHPDAVALFWAGCGADQNPLPRRTVEFAAEYGKQTAAAVDATLQSPMAPLTGTVRSVYREIDLGLEHLPTRDELDTDLKSTNVYIVRRAEYLLKQLATDGQLSPTYPYPVQMWALGDRLQWTFLGGEVVVDYSLRLRAELPGSANWIAGYCNDVMAYIPSKRVLLEGGYEGETAMIYYGLPSKWAIDVEERIIRTAHELSAQLAK